MWVQWLIVILVYIVPFVAASFVIIRGVTGDSPVLRAGLTTWLAVGFGIWLWLWLQFEPSLPAWLNGLDYGSHPVRAVAVMAAPAALLAGILARLRYHYPE